MNVGGPWAGRQRMVSAGEQQEPGRKLAIWQTLGLPSFAGRLPIPYFWHQKGGNQIAGGTGDRSGGIPQILSKERAEKPRVKELRTAGGTRKELLVFPTLLVIQAGLAGTRLAPICASPI